MTRLILLIMIGFSAVYANDTFVDSTTGLEWQDNYASKSVEKSWYDAKSYCRDLELSGHSDWRLPTIKELQSIVDISKNKPAIKDGFKNVASHYCWSSSEYADGTSDAWIVDFNNGNTYWSLKSDKLFVRCVRGRQ